jgi:hypothetical protein
LFGRLKKIFGGEALPGGAKHRADSSRSSGERRSGLKGDPLHGYEDALERNLQAQRAKGRGNVEERRRGLRRRSPLRAPRRASRATPSRYARTRRATGGVCVRGSPGGPRTCRYASLEEIRSRTSSAVSSSRHSRMVARAVVNRPGAPCMSLRSSSRSANMSLPGISLPALVRDLRTEDVLAFPTPHVSERGCLPPRRPRAGQRAPATMWFRSSGLPYRASAALRGQARRIGPKR